MWLGWCDIEKISNIVDIKKNIDNIDYIDIMQIGKLNLFAVWNAAYVHGGALFPTASMIVGWVTWVRWDFSATDAGSDSAVGPLVEEVHFFVLFSVVYTIRWLDFKIICRVSGLGFHLFLAKLIRRVGIVIAFLKVIPNRTLLNRHLNVDD